MAGPVGKRSDQRRRRNKPEGPQLVVAPAAPAVTVPEPSEAWHPLMVDWYRSLMSSGQSAFYEPSDWEMARLAAHVMSQELNSGEAVKAATLKEFQAIANNLMTTEGARRKLRVELQRGPQVVKDDESGSVMAGYKEMFM